MRGPVGTHTFKCIIIFFLLCSVNTQAKLFATEQVDTVKCSVNTQAKLFATEQVDTVKIAVRALSGVCVESDQFGSFDLNK